MPSIVYMDANDNVKKEVDFPANFKTDKAAVATASQGVIDASDAASGTIGELLTAVVASGSAVSLSNTTPTDITTLSLTPGDWDIYGMIVFIGSGWTTAAASPQVAGVSQTANTQPTSRDQQGTESQVITTTGSVMTIQTPYQRLSVSSTTVLHLVATANFSAGTCTGYGRVIARRAR